MMKLAVDDQMKPAITAEVARALRLLADAEPEVQALLAVDVDNHRSERLDLEDMLMDMAWDSLNSLYNTTGGRPADLFIEAALMIARGLIAARAKPEASASGAAAARPSAGRDPKSKSTGKAVKP